jgi:hypothetical protein
MRNARVDSAMFMFGTNVALLCCPYVRIFHSICSSDHDYCLRSNGDWKAHCAVRNVGAPTSSSFSIRMGVYHPVLKVLYCMCMIRFLESWADMISLADMPVVLQDGRRWCTASYQIEVEMQWARGFKGVQPNIRPCSLELGSWMLVCQRSLNT